MSHDSLPQLIQDTITHWLTENDLPQLIQYTIAHWITENEVELTRSQYYSLLNAVGELVYVEKKNTLNEVYEICK